MAKKKIRVRYAPSPTGHLHIGNARTALFNYLFARHNKGQFIIRIEDTDLKRNIADGEKSQLENLAWLGMDWDESPENPGEFGPYRQSERKDIYMPLIDQLLASNLAYKCYCTSEELEAEHDAQQARGEMPHYSGKCAHLTPAQQKEKEDAGLTPVVRFRVPRNKTYEFDDMVKGHISFESDSVGGDFVILKRDGMPTYNFAVAVDDHYMEISHVLRGDDHIANTPKQLMVYEAFDWTPPTFGHMTLIINTETGKKLSKRDESILQFIEQYRELGYAPDAMFNFIALLGWSPVGEDEIFSRQELIKMFDENRLSKSPASFDGKKLSWINNQYMKKTELDAVLEMTLEQYLKAGLIPDDPDPKTIEWIRQLTSLYHDQMSYAHEIIGLSDGFFNEPAELDDISKETLEVETAPIVINAFADKIRAMKVISAVNVKAAIKEIQKETKIKGRQLYMPIRVATTRESHGPELPESIELLGREKTLKHIQVTLDGLK